MNELILRLHIISSIIPTIITLYILYRSTMGLLNKKGVMPLDIKLPLYAMIFLYLQLLLGVALYIIHINDYTVIDNADQAVLVINRRFWALEHFIMMFFALVLSHIAYVYAKSIKSRIAFFKKSLIYFGIIFILIFSSMTINGMRYVGV